MYLSFKLINVIYLGRHYACIIAINGVLDILGMVVGLETFDDSLIKWLDVRCEVWFKVSDFNVLEVTRNYVTREVVLQIKHLPSFLLQCAIPVLHQLLI